MDPLVAIGKAGLPEHPRFVNDDKRTGAIRAQKTLVYRSMPALMFRRIASASRLCASSVASRSD